MPQDIRLGGKTYRKSHPIAEYRGALILALANTIAIPNKWGKFFPREVLQELLACLIATIDNSNPRMKELEIKELMQYLAGQFESIASGLEEAAIVLSTPQNYDKLALTAALALAEHCCLEARDRLELEDPKTSANIISILDVSADALNAAFEWVNRFVLVFSSGENGKLDKSAKWTGWSEEKYVELNI